jgi:tetratricopeptide (TPR) repeat protein
MLRLLPLMSRAGSAVLLVALATSSASAQSLPDLRIESFPPVSREPISRALDAARAAPEDATKVGALGMTLQAWDQWEGAAAVYARARELQRRFAWYYLGGVVEIRRARYKDAVPLLTEATSLEPTSLPAVLALADALFEAGRIDEAERQYASVSDKPAARPHASYGLGRVLASRAQYEAALAQFDVAVTGFPEFGAAWYAKGLALRNLGRLDEARDALTRAQEYGTRWPGVVDPLMARVRSIRDDPTAHLQRASDLERAGDLPGAIREEEAALAADASMVQAHVNLIALYGRQGDVARAEAHYREAVRLGANLAEAHYNYGVLMLLQQRDAEAAAAFEKAVAVNPQHAKSWNNLGRVAERAGKLDEALADYRRAVRLASSDATIRFNLGRMLLATKRFDEAIAEFEVLAKVKGPAQPRYVFGLATACVQAGDIASGRRHAIEAKRLAASLGQTELVAAIDRDLAKLPQP